MNIVITGAGKGIGFELSKLFIENKHNTIAISRNIDALKTIDSPFLKPLSFNLTLNSYSHLLEFTENELDKIDILVNNAGLLINKSFKNLTDSDFDDIFSTNVKAVFKLTQTLLPLFNKNAHIVNISSMGGVQGSSKFPGLSLYSASKGAVSILTECLAEEFKEEQISVNALALGAVQTEMLENAFPGFKAPLPATEMAKYIYEFALTGHKYYNGKVLAVSSSTP